MPDHEFEATEPARRRRLSDRITDRVELALECWSSLDSNLDGQLTKNELNAAANNLSLNLSLRNAAHLGEKYFDIISGLDGRSDVSREDLNLLRLKFKSGASGYDSTPTLPFETAAGSLG